MPWKRARLKGKDVWAEVDATGRPVTAEGRVAVRYSPDASARIYRAATSGVMMLDVAPQDLPDGQPAESSGAARGGSGGSGGRGSGFGSAGTRTAAQADAARSAASSLVAGFHREAVVCFTDGACRGNPGPAGAGAVMKLPDGQTRERSRALGMGTNNIGELAALDLALDLLDEAGVSSDTRIEILTDSKYAHGQATLGWKINANRELVQRIRGRLKNFTALRIHWIAGHVGVTENERADALANQGVAESAQGLRGGSRG